MTEYKFDVDALNIKFGEAPLENMPWYQFKAARVIAERLEALVEVQAQNHEDSQKSIALLEESLTIAQKQDDAGLQSLMSLIEVEKIRIDNHNLNLIGLDDRIKELEDKVKVLAEALLRTDG